MNRSGLVTALVLMLDGYDAVGAIALLRRHRSPWALCDRHFLDWLRHDAGTLAAPFRQPSVA